MVYESGFTTRRTYSSRPVVTSYAVSKKSTIDWEKCPFVPRPSLISDPVTAFGVHRSEWDQQPKSILDPICRAAIKPNYKILNEPIAPYVPVRDKNRMRILGMVRHHIDTVSAGGSVSARTSSDSIDTVLPRLYRNTSESLPVRRQTYRNEKSGAKTPRLDLATERPGTHRSRASSDYSYSSKSSVEQNNYGSNSRYSRPERSSYSSVVESSSRSGPGGSYNYNTERTSTTGAGPGGYSYSSTSTGSLPGGTKYRHFSYHV